MNWAILKEESVLPRQEGMRRLQQAAGWRNGQSGRLCVVPAA
jgi:hypothetical protein